MIITCDIGNTSTKLGLYEGEERIALSVVESKSSTAFKSIILQMIYKLSLREEQIEDAIIASVVPSLTPCLTNAIKEIINKEPIIIDNDNYYGIEIDDAVEGEVGADLLVICAYAYQKFKEELIIVSLGTASVLCHVTKDGKFKHCIIAPGYIGFATSLYSSAAKLPNMSAQRKGTFLASNTVDAMSIGVAEGFIGMIRYLIHGMRQATSDSARVVCCGGAAKDFITSISTSEYYDPDYVSDGLGYIYNRYIKHD